MKKMAAQVNLFCFLMFFSVWLVIWCLKIGTFVLIKVLLTYLKKKETFLGQPQSRAVHEVRSTATQQRQWEVFNPTVGIRPGTQLAF